MSQVTGNIPINFFAPTLSWAMCGQGGQADSKHQNVNFGDYKRVILQ